MLSFWNYNICSKQSSSADLKCAPSQAGMIKQLLLEIVHDTHERNLSWSTRVDFHFLYTYLPSLKQNIRLAADKCVYYRLTHWGWVTHICIISSDNGVSPGIRQAIIWSNDGILWIGPLETNFSEISIEIYICCHSRKCIWKWGQETGSHHISASMC